tara:strand:+ start:335 stop:715 length:381 start_codon:yes stop_codon:yes gene_type:complete
LELVVQEQILILLVMMVETLFLMLLDQKEQPNLHLLAAVVVVLTMPAPEVEPLVDLVVEDLKHKAPLVLEILHQLHQLRDTLDQEIGMQLLAAVEVLEDLTLDILDHLVADHLQMKGERKTKFQVV